VFELGFDGRQCLATPVEPLVECALPRGDEEVLFDHGPYVFIWCYGLRNHAFEPGNVKAMLRLDGPDHLALLRREERVLEGTCELTPSDVEQIAAARRALGSGQALCKRLRRLWVVHDEVGDQSDFRAQAEVAVALVVRPDGVLLDGDVGGHVLDEPVDVLNAGRLGLVRQDVFGDQLLDDPPLSVQ